MSLATIPKPAERLDWLAARRPFFNASAAACLYGCHPHLTLADVVAEKLSDDIEDRQTDAMERGDRLEPVLGTWFGDRHGVAVTQPDVLHVNGRLMATLDFEPVGDSDTWVEVKTTAYRWDEVPEHVRWQVTAQAAASGKARCWVVWIDADMRYKEALVTPDPSHVADVLERAERFMDFIDLGMVPEGVEMTAEHLARLFPAPNPGTFVDLDDEGLAAVVRWEQLRRQRVELEKAEREAKDAVARLVAEAEGARYDGRLVATWKANKASERVDWKAVEADHPDLAKSYRRTVPGARVLRATRELEGVS